MSQTNTQPYAYNLRTVVHGGVGSIQQIPDLFTGFGAKRVVLLSDAGLKQVGIVDKVAATFEGKDTVELVGIYTDISPDAGSITVNAALAFALEVKADAILAVGGGSVLDASKAVKYAMQEGLTDIKKGLGDGMVMKLWPEAQHSGIPHITVPTTAGTGAEMSAAAVIYNEDTGMKCGMVVSFLDADMCVHDPELMAGLPSFLTASTGMDALTHALEAVASPTRNHWSDSHAIYSAQLIEKSLPKAVANGADLEARADMLAASGIAIDAFISSFSVFPVHIFAHAFGAVFHVPHGDANAVMLPLVIEHFPDYYLPNAERLALAMNMDTQGKTGQALLDALVQKIRDLHQTLGCATDFTKWGVTADAADKIEASIKSDPLAASFTALTSEDIAALTAKAAG
jgi:alcohol dehydrogenase class IV